MSETVAINGDFRLPCGPMMRNVFVGQTGSGKSYAARKVVENLAKLAPIVVLDPPGVWYGMRLDSSGKSVPNPIPIIGGVHADIPLDPRQGATYARWIVRMRSSAIFDLSGELGVAEMRRFATAFLAELFRFKGTERYPLHLVLEEADEFAPQSVGQEGGDLAKCLSMVDRVCRRGRTRGIGYTLITQRPAVISKNVINQGEVFFSGKLTGPRDRKAMEEWFDAHGTKDKRRQVIDSLPTLQNGVAWWWDTRDDSLTQAKCSPIKTYDSMGTPTGDDEGRAVTLGTLDAKVLTAELAKLAEEAKANDPDALKAEVARLKGEIKALGKGKGEAGEIGPTLVELRRQLAELKKVNADLIGENGKLAPLVGHLELEANHWRTMVEDIRRTVMEGAKAVHRIAEAECPKRPRIPPALCKDTAPVVRRGAAGAEVSAGSGELAGRVVSPEVRRSIAGSNTPGSENLPGPHAKILGACRWWAGIGNESPTIHQVAVLSGYREGGTFSNHLGAMRTAGLLEPSDRDGRVRMTDLGWKSAAEPPPILDRDQLRQSIAARLSEPQRRIINALFDTDEAWATIDDLAEASGYSPGGTFSNHLGSLRSLGLLEPAKRDGTVALAGIWFPEGLA